MTRSCLLLAYRGVFKNGETEKDFGLGKLPIKIQSFSPSGRLERVAIKGPPSHLALDWEQLACGGDLALQVTVLSLPPLHSHRCAIWLPRAPARDPAAPPLLWPGYQSVHKDIPSFITSLPPWQILHTEVILGCILGHHPQIHAKHRLRWVTETDIIYWFLLVSFSKEASVSKFVTLYILTTPMFFLRDLVALGSNRILLTDHEGELKKFYSTDEPQ